MTVRKRRKLSPDAPQVPRTPSTPPGRYLMAAKLTEADVARWQREAAALPADKAAPTAPVRVVIDESIVVARFVERRWEPTVDPATKSVTVPGLSSAGPRLARAIAGEIRQLHDLVQQEQARWIFTAPSGGANPVERARFVLRELSATVEYHFDDGVDDERDEQLARVQSAHRDDGDSREDLASALHDYAVLAGPYADEMHGLGGFDRSLVAEAAALAATLRNLPGDKADQQGAARAVIDLRDRYAALLFDRMGAVRAAARFVFRHHPDVVREVTSAWERSRRSGRRRKPQPPPTPA